MSSTVMRFPRPSHKASASTLASTTRRAAYDSDSSDEEEAAAQAEATYGKDIAERAAAAVISQAVMEKNLRELRLEQPDFRSMTSLKPDHVKFPCWFLPNLSVYVEQRSPASQGLVKRAQDFLTAIAEPESRPIFVHHFRLTAYSLYAGASMGMETSTILSTIESLSKNTLPDGVRKFIEECTESFGKAKIVLRRGHFWVESRDSQLLERMLRESEVIRTSRVSEDVGFQTSAAAIENMASLAVTHGVAGANSVAANSTTTSQKMYANMLEDLGSRLALEDENYKVDEDYDMDALDGMRPKKRAKTGGDAGKAVSNVVSKFEIRPLCVEAVSEEALRLNLPLMKEYDWSSDDSPDLEIALRGTLRDHQKRAINKMFGNGRARSGIIVLPCGAGKTLTAIAACCMIRKSTVVFCPNEVAVEQWAHEFKRWTTIRQRKDLVRFTSKIQDEWPDASRSLVLITTYSIMSIPKETNTKESRAVKEKIEKREWGLCVADEVHTVPAASFRKSLLSVKCHCTVGLTATLVREDNRIGDLNFIIGPKLYEADWQELTNQNYLARVQCVNVLLPMAPIFMGEYLRSKSEMRRQLLLTVNPAKYAALTTLLEHHEKLGDKILVFCENITPLEMFAKEMVTPSDKVRGLHGRHYMDGGTRENEREGLLYRFRRAAGSPKVNFPLHDLRSGDPIQTLFISKLGDAAIDLPEANVIIEISSHFGSRMQEAQRLGRILRPKSSARLVNARFNAFFYALISSDTSEAIHSARRKKYLMDQGYHYSIALPQPGLDWSGDSVPRETQRRWLSEISEQAELKRVERTKKGAAR